MSSNDEELISMSLNNDEDSLKSSSGVKNWRRHLKNSSRDHFRKTSVFWFRRIGERNRPLIEKIFWICCFLISFSFCVILIHRKLSTDQIIITFANRQSPISELPFPAITICPQSKSKQSVFNYTQIYHQLESNQSQVSQDDLKKYLDLSLLCDPHLGGVGANFTHNFNMTFLQSIAPTLTETIWNGVWRSNSVNSTELFTPIVTDVGICFTFNLLNSDDIFKSKTEFHEGIPKNFDPNPRSWFLEEGGYQKRYKISTMDLEHPKRVATSGRIQGLFILLGTKKSDSDFICKGPTPGFTVHLHSPDELPLMKSHYISSPLKFETLLAIEPRVLKTSKKLRSYSPRERGCYFSDERPLRFFREYNQRLCELECLSNYTLRECGCVNFYMPREESTNICTASKLKCIINVRKAQENPECDCLPSCNSIKYSAEVSHEVFEYEETFKAFKMQPDVYDDLLLSRVAIYFKDSHFLPLERKEIESCGDFLVYFCAILSFFTGFSILTLVELIYFYFRFLYDLCRN